MTEVREAGHAHKREPDRVERITGQVALGVDARSLDRDIADFKGSLGGFNFVAGERYSEFKPGDRMAEYGLGALVLGGAAAVAVKTGFGKAIFKFLIFGVIAFGGAAAAFFRKLFRRG